MNSDDSKRDQTAWQEPLFLAVPVTSDRIDAAESMIQSLGLDATNIYTVCAVRDSEDWQAWLQLLAPVHRVWAQQAILLCLVVARSGNVKNFSAVWESLPTALIKDGMQVIRVAGIDYEKAMAVTNIPEGDSVEALLAVGCLAT